MAVEIGVSNLYYAKMNFDEKTGVSYQAPKPIALLMSIKVTPNVSESTLYADNGPAETHRSLSKIEVEVNPADVDLDIQADLLGQTVIGGVLHEKSTDTPPYVAIGFESQKTNGKNRYTWLLKGRFGIWDTAAESTGEQVKFNTPTLKATFIKRKFDDEWRRKSDEDHPDYLPIIGQNWFASVEGALDTTPPSVSTSIPAANATGVAANSTIVWNFNEPIWFTDVKDSNFLVLKDSDGSNVAGTLTVNAARTQVTFTPASNLSATTAYRAIVTKGVHDLMGNTMASNDVRKFTTA